MPEILALRFVSLDAACVLADDAAEHAPEEHEDHHRASAHEERGVDVISLGADACDVESGGEPDEARQEQ